MKRPTVLWIMALVLFLLSCPAFAGSPNMKPGEWEIVTNIVMEGMPFPMPPVKTVQCITREDLNNPEKTTPKVSKEKDDCEVKDYKMSGNKASWKIVCTGRNKGTGTGEMTYAGDSYSGTMKYETQEAVMNYTIKAKRIGDCKK